MCKITQSNITDNSECVLTNSSHDDQFQVLTSQIETNVATTHFDKEY